MSDLFAAVKSSWQAYAALTALVAVLVAFASFPGRVAALESWRADTDIVLRYIACTMKAQAEGSDPSACESHLSPDLVNYLRPGGGR